MNTKMLRSAPAIVAVILAALFGELRSQAASPGSEGRVTPPSTNALSPTLVAKDANAGWDELQASTQPPPSPPGWRAKAPTPQQQQTYYLPYVKALSNKAKDFYTHFPNDSNAPMAKMMELKFLFMAVTWGDTKDQDRLDSIEKSLLNDPKLPDEARVNILHSVARSGKPDKMRPLLEGVAAGSGPADLKAAAKEELDKLEALGRPVALQFTAVDGRAVDLAKLKGKVVLIDFWATWCGPCVGEVPNVKKTYDEFHSKGFEIVGISLDKEKDKLTAFTAEHKMEWPQFFDGLYWQNKYARQFGIESIPTMWLIDKKGNLRDTDAREDLAGGVQKLLAE